MQGCALSHEGMGEAQGSIRDENGSSWGARVKDRVAGCGWGEQTPPVGRCTVLLSPFPFLFRFLSPEYELDR